MTIYCDESGYTGVNLLETNQPHFVFSGVQLTDDIKQEIKELVNSNYKVQGEVKGKNLVQNDSGRKTLLKLFQGYSENAKVVYHDKKYALAAKIFEYAIEPNLKTNWIAYKTDFHRFISQGLYYYFLSSSNDAEKIFKSFMDTIRGENKNSIFDIDHSNKDFLIWWLFEIVKHNPDNFYDEIKEDGNISPWILDLTSTSLMGILSEYGKKNKKLTVICDNSNLYKENFLIESLNNLGKIGKRKKFLGTFVGYKLKENIKTLKSKDEFGLQVADLFATSVSYSLKHKDYDFSKEILNIVLTKCICDPTYCIMPDTQISWTKEQTDFFYEFMHIIWKEQRN